jgi:hypothetical protein
MTKHKWHDEIVAWAGGAEIQYKNKFDPDDAWDIEVEMGSNWNSKVWVFRIKPQPKQPKYLYVYTYAGEYILGLEKAKEDYCGREFIGKIEVQDD